jgi:hypothetical protein
MAERESQKWRDLLQDALGELSREKLPEKIARAEVAVCRRINQMKANPRPRVERRALDDALTSLSILKKRHFPGWSKGSLNAKKAR